MTPLILAFALAGQYEGRPARHHKPHAPAVVPAAPVAPVAPVAPAVVPEVATGTEAPPAPPVPPVALWKLADDAGTTWTHPDKGYLERWVFARDSAMSRPVAMPTYRFWSAPASACPSGRCR